MYKFNCGFSADKEMLSSQKWQWGTTGNHSEIRNVNLYSPLAFIVKKRESQHTFSTFGFLPKRKAKQKKPKELNLANAQRRHD
jgi:hypothetical protein